MKPNRCYFSSKLLFLAQNLMIAENLLGITFVKDITLLLNAFGVANCLVLSIWFYRTNSPKSNKKNKLVALLLLVLGLTILNTVLNHSGYHSVFPNYEVFSNALAYTIAPLLYLIVSDKSPDANSKRSWMHLSPFGVIILGLITLQFIPSSNILTSIVESLVSGPIHKLFWNVHFFIYLYLAAKSLPILHTKRNAKLDHVLFWGIAVIWVVNLLILFFGNLIQPLSSIIRLNITLLFLSLTIVIFYKKLLPSDVNPKMKRKSRTKESNEYSLVIEEIEEKQLYINPGLNIRNLSKTIGIPYSELSRIINDGSGTNFNNFINRMRINHVLKQIRTNAHNNYTIMGLARKAGFRSASSFYSAFKKEMGTTPSDFIKNL